MEVKNSPLSGFHIPEYHPPETLSDFLMAAASMEGRLRAKFAEGQITDSMRKLRIRRASPYLYVQGKMISRPTVLTFSGKDEDPPPHVKKALQLYFTALALVGASEVDGGGQGGMRLCAHMHRIAIAWFQKCNYVTRFSSKIASVPLDIEEEPPHHYYSHKLTTYPFREIMFRVMALMLLGHPIQVTVLRHGRCGRHELESVDASIRTNTFGIYEKHSPILTLAEYERCFAGYLVTAASDMVFGSTERIARKQKEAEQIRSENLKLITEDYVKSAQALFQSFDDKSASVYGMPLSRVWEIDNLLPFWPTVVEAFETFYMREEHYERVDRNCSDRVKSKPISVNVAHVGH